MDPNNIPSSSTSMAHPQPLPSNQHYRPPTNVHGPHESLPSYPSSTLQYYCPSSYHATNAAHIPSFHHNFPVQSHDLNDIGQMLLPSASQSHVPSLRRTPSVPFADNINDDTIIMFLFPLFLTNVSTIIHEI